MTTIDEAKIQVASWLNLQQANRVLDDVLNRRVQEAAGISMPEYEVLFRLSVTAGRPLLMAEIATELLASPSGATRIADRLQKDGLIARKTPRDNRRVVQVSLTPRGKRVLDKADRAFRSALGESFSSHLSASDLDVLRRLMRKLLEGNGAWTDARCSPGVPRASS